MIVITTLFSVPNYSRAEGTLDEWGGTLLEPFISLFASFGDTLMNFMQWAIIGEASTKFDFSDFSWMPMVTEADQYYAPIEGHNFPEETEFATDIQEGSRGYRVPCIDYSPREIFSGVIPALDINFISPNPEYAEDTRSISNQLQVTIASWYVGLRNFSLLILMVVLVYVGIRMMLTSLAAEKAKYKQMFLDWLIAMCLIFFLHYIMSFTLTMVETLTDALATNVTDVNVTVYSEKDEESGEPTGEPEAHFSTNLTGLARFRLQYNSGIAKLMYLIIYLALVIYTLMFTITYLKRVLIMAFLTLIAPLVCMTYPIDKIGDGKAQAFGFWLREYIFNALLQPFHLLLYAVFIGSAFELATKNILYSLVALGFIFSAEKILRKMFGFEKSGTTSTLGAFAGGALVNRMLSGMGRVKPPDEKELEEKEKANKIKPLNFNNGAYGLGEGGAYDGSSPSGLAGGARNAGGSSGTGIDVFNMRPGDNLASISAANGGTPTGSSGRRNGGTTTPDTSLLASLDNVAPQEDSFTPRPSLVSEFSNAQGIRGKASALVSGIKTRWPEAKESVPERVGNGLEQIRATAAFNAKNTVGRAFKHPFKNGAKVLAKGTKFVAKTGLRAGLAAGGLAAGLAAGIATGDLDNALQMGIAGAAAGNSAGKTAAKYGEKGIKAVGRGIDNNIVKPYKEGMLGVKNAKAQREFDELNTVTERKYTAEETRKDDGTYRTQSEIDEFMQKRFAMQQSGIYNSDDQIMAVKLQEETEAKYMRIAQEEMIKEEEWVQQNISARERAEFQAMSAEQIEQIEASKERANVEKAEKIRRMRRVDNKDEYYKRVGQRAKEQAIIAASFRSQTAGMDDTEKETYMIKRIMRSGHDEQTARRTANQIMGDIDFLNGAKKNV